MRFEGVHLVLAFRPVIYNCQNKCTTRKRILALPIWVQKYMVFESDALEKSKLEDGTPRNGLGHPVLW